MKWYMAVNVLNPAACQAETIEEAQRTLASDPELGPVGQQDQAGRATFGVIVCPLSIIRWLNADPPPHCEHRVMGGWLAGSAFIPVQGTDNLRIVERRMIEVPKGTIPHIQDGRNG
jgi:hypothetical protein